MKGLTTLGLAVGLTMGLFLSSGALAGNHSNKADKADKAKKSQSQEQSTEDKVIDAAVDIAIEVLTGEQREIIRTYYESGGGKGVKNKGLPPGIAKNLKRGKPLPPGIQKTRAPGDLVSQLNLRDSQDLIIAGTEVILVDKTIDIIADVMKDVILENK